MLSPAIRPAESIATGEPWSNEKPTKHAHGVRETGERVLSHMLIASTRRNRRSRLVDASQGTFLAENTTGISPRQDIFCFFGPLCEESIESVGK